MAGSYNGYFSLTPLEERLFALLLEAANNTQTVVRIAGGWARDKLLNLNSDDIDVALDNVTGEVFAHAVKQVLIKHDISSGSIAIIAANPEQSKHLETATMRVLDLEVDFVNLRAETYSSDSRIPTSTFGSALEDAYRRDFTINAIFYNLNEGKVEDFTSMFRISNFE